MKQEWPEAPLIAEGFFGERTTVILEFARILGSTGVDHGLIGPREVPRLWERHLLNCAVVEDSFPKNATVGDIGSGAGLPGIVLAVARPDLEVHLVEPMLRRTSWLESTVGDLGLDNVTVHRARAEDCVGRFRFPHVTARAVARLDKLARWCVPLLDHGGLLVAIKGRTASEELVETRPDLVRLGLITAAIVEHGLGLLEHPVLTVNCRFGHDGVKSDGGPRVRP